MLRIIARQFGPPVEVLHCEQAVEAALAQSDVAVRMIASPINPSDLVTIRGAYPHRVALPFVPGFEGVGVVEQTGRVVTGLRVGQRVLPLGSAGGWQTLKSLHAGWCVPVPDDLTDEQAATAYINPLTARLMVERLEPKPGMAVGVNAANSAIGRILIRMLHRAGVQAVAVVRSLESKAALDDEPVSQILLEGDRLPTLAGGFDAIGGTSGAAMAGSIAAGGTLLHYGLLSGVPLFPGLGRLHSVAIEPFWLRSWVHSVTQDKFHSVMAAVFRDIVSGLASVAIEGRYPFDEMKTALVHNAYQSRHGKILLIGDSRFPGCEK